MPSVIGEKLKPMLKPARRTGEFHLDIDRSRFARGQGDRQVGRGDAGTDSIWRSCSWGGP
jgi:hypothetical protein